MTDAAAPKPARADARRNRELILNAAEEVFNAHGPAASTEDVARRAGVGIGTVFRHFPTKTDLLKHIVGRSLAQLTERIDELTAHGDPAVAFHEFFTDMVSRASANKTIVDLLGEAGADLNAAKPVRLYRDAVAGLLTAGQDAGSIRADIGTDEALALLLGMCQAAVGAGWDATTQERCLAVVFDGLRPSAPTDRSPD